MGEKILDVFMLETLKLSKKLKSSQDDFNVLDNFNVSIIKTAIVPLSFVATRLFPTVQYISPRLTTDTMQ